MRQNLIFALAATALFLAKPAPAQTDLSPLRGLETLTVVIEDLDPSLTENGLAAADLRKLLEGRIGMMGIRLLSVEEAIDAAPGPGYLRLAIRTERVSDLNRIYSVGLELRQKARLVRDPSIETTAVTWRAQELGLSPLKDMTGIRGDTASLIDRFVTDLSKANPKPEKK